MPYPMSNRSSPMLVYTSKDEGGNPWHYERVSSLKTEFIVKNHADLIGSDVVSWAYINMIMWREYEGGIDRAVQHQQS